MTAVQTVEPLLPGAADDWGSFWHEIGTPWPLEDDDRVRGLLQSTSDAIFGSRCKQHIPAWHGLRRSARKKAAGAAATPAPTAEQHASAERAARELLAEVNQPSVVLFAVLVTGSWGLLCLEATCPAVMCALSCHFSRCALAWLGKLGAKVEAHRRSGKLHLCDLRGRGRLLNVSRFELLDYSISQPEVRELSPETNKQCDPAVKQGLIVCAGCMHLKSTICFW